MIGVTVIVGGQSEVAALGIVNFGHLLQRKQVYICTTVGTNADIHQWWFIDIFTKQIS